MSVETSALTAADPGGITFAGGPDFDLDGCADAVRNVCLKNSSKSVISESANHDSKLLRALESRPSRPPELLWADVEDDDDATVLSRNPTSSSFSVLTSLGVLGSLVD